MGSAVQYSAARSGVVVSLKMLVQRGLPIRKRLVSSITLMGPTDSQFRLVNDSLASSSSLWEASQATVLDWATSGTRGPVAPKVPTKAGLCWKSGLGSCFYKLRSDGNLAIAGKLRGVSAIEKFEAVLDWSKLPFCSLII